MQAQVQDADLPDLRGKYQPLALLGSGGMANVHLAVSRGPGGFDKLVVLKTLRSDAAFDPELRKMFLGEARISARLSHPNVIHTYEVAIADDGAPVLVMEYLEGAPLNVLMDRARGAEVLPLRMRLSIVCDALEGLHYAHELRDYDDSHLAVVHRDISPHNLHVGLDGIVKVLDFGIARAKGLSLQTRTGVVKGKVRYMAPEQIRGEKIDRRADVYAMGVVLWELATDTRLWKGMADIETMHRVVSQGVPRASTVNANVPAILDAIIARALSRDASDRHTDGVELQADLERQLGEMGGRAHPREIGKVVAALFSDVHTARKQMIEQLVADTSHPPSDRPTVVTGRHKAPPLTLPPLGGTGSRSAVRPAADSTGSRSDSRIGFTTVHPAPAPTEIARPRFRRALVFAALPLVIAAALVVRAVAPAASQARNAAPSASAASIAPATSVAPAAAASVAPQPRPSEVRVVVNVTPSDATVLVDNVALRGEPAASMYAIDPSLHTVRVERGGYLPWTSRVSFDHEIELWVTLDPVPAATPFPRINGARAKGASSASPAVGAPSAKKIPRALDTSVPW